MVSAQQEPRILILGGGVTGIIAARTLHERGIDNFLIIEARNELGGRMRSHSFGNSTIELGANWIQGTQEGDGPANPILVLAEKHGVKTHYNDLYGSLTTFDVTGAVDYVDTFNGYVNASDEVSVVAGARVQRGLVDASSRTGFSVIGSKPKTAQEIASQYFIFAQAPDQSSWLASAWNSNFTYVPEAGGFADEDLLSVDQRGFKTLIQEEANEFLSPGQLLLNTTVAKILYSEDGVMVSFANGSTIEGDFALCTFSLGVLQNDDVLFEPELPAFKTEAIQSSVMATYTKIFLKFPQKFWFDTEMAMYADTERGRYPIWQSLDHPNFLPGSGILFVTVTGDFSIRIESLPDEVVKAEVLEVLATMYPETSIPEPTDFFFYRWNLDPLYRGSYSNWPPSFLVEHHGNLRANVERLYFAGEATSKHSYGFLHGAYDEGLQIATILADCIDTGKCDGLPHVEDVLNVHSYDL
ncbi:amine oxidase [Cylindrobasidium torrendii FP15055 ss-10]|uniref:Amine oxidase n=1 Tax=Cylindrobasidium torrendii FP15055 ss-10 TaxID=1314674 RepID=A0A0D7BMR5_9AGAR|nr:amine oxidase [Cylindrobasidium torrendii FP15055 ss-10]